MEVPWTLFRKAALVLFGISLLAGFVSTALFMGHRLPVETWRIIFILALVLLTITGTVLIPGLLLPNITSPHPEFLSDDLEDEWMELRQRTISRPHILLLGGVISALTYLWCLFYYGKPTNAFWFGWMPVGVTAIALSLLLFAFVRRTDWYNNRFYRTPTWVMLVAFAGFAAALFLGIFMTEQVPSARNDQSRCSRCTRSGATAPCGSNTRGLSPRSTRILTLGNVAEAGQDESTVECRRREIAKKLREPMESSGMERTRRFLEGMGLPARDLHDLPSSTQRFADGGQWRVEIPSVEGPNALRAVFESADELGVPVHRVSQGSGVMLLTDDELDQMREIAAERGIEVGLFVGPRAGWDTGAMAYSTAGRIVAPKVRGADQLVQAVEDVRRACEHGIESVLVTDEGLLEVLAEMKRAGELPPGLILKGSVMLGAANPVSVRNLERLGLTTFNVPTDLSLAQLAALRAATTMPLDIYIEVPDDVGGFIRHYEIAEIVRVTAPVYLKFGLRNAPNIYPSGTHLEATAVSLTRERLRRAKLGLDLLHRLDPDAIMSPLPQPVVARA